MFSAVVNQGTMTLKGHVSKDLVCLSDEITFQVGIDGVSNVDFSYVLAKPKVERRVGFSIYCSTCYDADLLVIIFIFSLVASFFFIDPTVTNRIT